MSCFWPNKAKSGNQGVFVQGISLGFLVREKTSQLVCFDKKPVLFASWEASGQALFTMKGGYEFICSVYSKSG